MKNGCIREKAGLVSKQGNLSRRALADAEIRCMYVGKVNIMGKANKGYCSSVAAIFGEGREVCGIICQ